MQSIIEQVLADIAAAQTVELLGQIYGWASANIGDPEQLQQVAAACQARDAQLQPNAVAQPETMPAPPVPEHVAEVVRAPAVMIDVAGIVPVSITPPGWVANADALAVGTRNATGNGGLPALDTLRVTLVDLVAASWDCGIDLTKAPHIRDVTVATPAQCWETATYMLDAIRTHLAIARNKK